jgi:hypothetical protein
MRRSDQSYQDAFITQDSIPSWRGTSVSGRYTSRKVFVIDPDPASIKRVLSHIDPDQVAAGGYCIENHGEYWKDFVSSAEYTP